MELTMLKGKIHRATVTQAELDYVGSITIDTDLLNASGIREYEQVQIVNINNGARFRYIYYSWRIRQWGYMFKWCCCTTCANYMIKLLSCVMPN